jgi:hypothetical protein
VVLAGVVDAGGERGLVADGAVGGKPETGIFCAVASGTAVVFTAAVPFLPVNIDTTEENIDGPAVKKH